jgi:hypothetical protein
MTRDEMHERSMAFQRETGCSSNERKAFFDGFLEAHDLFFKPTEFSLADLLLARKEFEKRIKRLVDDRDFFRGYDIDKYEERELKLHQDPYYYKLERVNKMIIELIEKI